MAAPESTLARHYLDCQEGLLYKQDVIVRYTYISIPTVCASNTGTI